MRIDRRRSVGLALLFLGVSLPAWAATQLSPKAQAFLKKHGSSFGLTEKAALSEPTIEKLNWVLEQLPGEDPDRELVPHLKTLVKPGIGDSDHLGGRLLYTRGRDGVPALTPFGRRILMDFLTAQDGITAQGRLVSKASFPANERGSFLERLRAEGALMYDAAQKGDPSDALGTGRRVFDAAGEKVAQVLYPMPAYGRWAELRKEGNLKNIYTDPKTGAARLIIAGKTPAVMDRYRTLDRKEEAQILRETGLESLRKLLPAAKGRVVRAVDNLVVVELPREMLPLLGRTLEQDGIHSAPSLKVELVNAVHKGLTQGRMPLGGLLPFPKGAVSGLLDRFRPHSNVANDLMKVRALWEKGMEGEGAVVGIIDSGLDMKHPDFQGRVLAYIDLVQDYKDGIGHGTHVAGLVGGDGKASEGFYKGAAPKTKFVIVQVFNSSGGGASEDSILAAMKILSSLPGNKRSDVVSMSLGIAPPFGHNLNKSSLLADYMMVRNNIFMSIAAGNSGPKQHTVGAPAAARHVLTVTGTNKEKVIPFFPSRGPISNWPGKDYNKPDITTVAGDIHRGNPCRYAPGGLIAAKSSTIVFPPIGGPECDAPGNPFYRYMTGTSMATPEASGVAADVVGYLKSKGVPYATADVKALLMETAEDLGRPEYEQGAGFLNGEKLARTLAERVEAGTPVGNIPLMLSRQVPEFYRWYLARYKSVRPTPLGLLDTQTGHLVNTDQEADRLQKSAVQEMASMSRLERWKMKIEYALSRRRK